MNVWLTVNEAAFLLGVNRKTVWDWIQNYLDKEHGEDVSGPCLPGYNAPGSTLLFVREEDIATFKENNKYELAERDDIIAGRNEIK